MKTLITEDKARVESKYQDAQVIMSFHNFIVLTNNEKAVSIPMEERRFFLLNGQKVLYGPTDHSAAHKKRMTLLWTLVKDPQFQQLFYQYLLTVDTSNMTKGRAPFTAFKQELQQEQAPAAIRFCIALLDDPDLMACPMANMREADRILLMDEFVDKGRFKLKLRTLTQAGNQPFSNLFGDEWEDMMLTTDFQDSEIREYVPIAHVYDCIRRYFQGQQYVERNDADHCRALTKQLGLWNGAQVKAPAGGSAGYKKAYRFPSIEGLRYMLKKKRYIA